MPVTIELPDEALSRLQAEATRRGISIDEVIAELAATLVSEHAEKCEGHHRPAFVAAGSSLSISGVGASGGRHGWARDADEALAQGFGLD